MQSLWSSLLVFLLILAAIPATAWLLRRSQSMRPGGGTALDVISAVAVGSRERIAIVRAGQSFLVVGITPQSIALLAELDEAPEAASAQAVDPASPAGRFAGLLKGLSDHG